MRHTGLVAMVTLGGLGGCVDAPTTFPGSDAEALRDPQDASAVSDVARVDARSDGGDPPVDSVSFTVRPLGPPGTMTTPPTWRVAGVWAVSYPLGLRAEDTPHFGELQDRFAAPNHAFSVSLDQTVHVRPHDGPYATEIASGLRAAGLSSRARFTARDFIGPQAIYLVTMLEAGPDAPRGVTPDGSDRAMIPVGAFPIRFDGVLARDGALYDANAGSMLGAPTVTYPGAWEGHTHLIFTTAEDTEYGPPGVGVEGRYTWRVLIADATGRGYAVEAAFEVRCTPDEAALPACRGAASDGGAGGPDDVGDATAADDAPDVAGHGAVGDPCAVDADCDGGFCLTGTSELPLPGNYCTAHCPAPFVPCGVGESVCVPIDFGRGTETLCLRRCEPGGCRAEYRCLPFVPGGVCFAG